MNLGNLVERHLRPIVVNRNRVEHVNVRSPGARGRHFTAEVFHRLLHARLEGYVDFFQGRMSHSSELLVCMRIKTVDYKPKAQVRGSRSDCRSKNPRDMTWFYLCHLTSNLVLPTDQRPDLSPTPTPPTFPPS